MGLEIIFHRLGKVFAAAPRAPPLHVPRECDPAFICPIAGSQRLSQRARSIANIQTKRLRLARVFQTLSRFHMSPCQRSVWFRMHHVRRQEGRPPSGLRREWLLQAAATG